jgi:hypothetical protein
MADLLDPAQTVSATREMTLAVAGLVRGVVAAELRTDKSAHFSRRRSNYQPVGGRYHNGDPRLTYQYRAKAADLAVQWGLVVQHLGKVGLGRESVLESTELGRELASALANDTELGEMTPKAAETIILRDASKNLMDYRDTADTRRWRGELAIINEAMRNTEVTFRGKRMYIPDMNRIFNVTWERGGRMYCRGNSHQNMPGGERHELMIDGMPTDEVDFSCLHPMLAYHEAGVPAPTGDLYAITGFWRPLVKLAVNTMFNAANDSEAAGSIAHTLETEAHFREHAQLPLDHTTCLKYAWTLMRAVKAKHHPIRKWFCSDAGARFQRIDAEMAVAVMLEMITLCGRCPLYLYDSFRVPSVDKNLLRAVMARVAGRYGLTLSLKEDTHTSHIPPTSPGPIQPTTTHPSTPTPSTRSLHMGDHHSDLGICKTDIRDENTPKTPVGAQSRVRGRPPEEKGPCNGPAPPAPYP